MKHDVTVKITAGTQRDAEEIARAVEELSGLFSATEWKAISAKLRNIVIRQQIRAMIRT
jgi:hypothetical protein